MAQKRPSRRRGTPEPKANASASGKQWPPVAPVAPVVARREVRPYIYAAFDLAMAAIYAVLLLQVPTEHALHTVLLWSTVGAVLVAGAGMMWRSPWGWRIAVLGCAVLLAVTVVLLVLILLSASFLAGVYGAMGRGAAFTAILAGALVIELVGFLPALQMKFLFTRAGRRHYAGAGARPAT
jgi:hypothetical protein